MIFFLVTLFLTGGGGGGGGGSGSSVVFVGSLDRGPVFPMQFSFGPKKATCFPLSSNTVTLSSHPKTFVLVTVP